MVDDVEKKRRLLIVSGLSGAGKSLVLNSLEDQDFYCIDNLPVSLFDQLAKLLTAPMNDFPEKVGVGIDARSPEFDLATLPNSIALLRDKGVIVEIIFIEASKSALTTRFSETRRKHPLSSDDMPLTDAIDKERRILADLSDIADLRIDTSHMVVHELRGLVRDRLANRPVATLSMQFISFGYKHGIPRDADFVFDVRCLPNPYWQKHLRMHSGKDQPVKDYLEQQATVIDMVSHIQNFLEQLIPQFESENRSYLCIAIGCTGGHHRSVYIVDRISEYFRALQKHVVIRHRDL